jgi:hypothetical protein
MREIRKIFLNILFEDGQSLALEFFDETQLRRFLEADVLLGKPVFIYPEPDKPNS